MARYVYDPDAGRPLGLASGGSLAPGETVDLSPQEQSRNKDLIDGGVLRALKQEKEKPVKEAD